jgi:DNA-directed RNA polymerase specialized sigma24 family protein
VSETEITKHLDRLLRLVAVAICDGKTKRQQMVLLQKAGFQPSEIADFIGTTANSVRVEMSNMRKQRGAKKAKSGEAECE